MVRGITTVRELAATCPETIGARLAGLAADDPDRILLTTPEATLSYGAMEASANRVAKGFEDLGVRKGDVVCQLLPNCADIIVNWMGLAKLGAVHAPLNYQFYGAALARLINVTQAKVLVLDESLQDSIAEIVDDIPTVRTIVYRTVSRTFEPDARLSQFTRVLLDVLGEQGAKATAVDVHYADPALLMFTSGTTGPSKAVEISHRYALTFAALYIEHWRLTEDDVFYTPYPLYHVDASFATYLCALHRHARAVIVPRFSASGFWDDIRKHGATVTTFMGAVATFLFNLEARADDADNPLRVVLMGPVPPFWREFSKRFDVTIVTAFGGTEPSMVCWQPPEEDYIEGTYGRVVDGYQVRIGDDHDESQPTGMSGEILVRAERPYTMMTGYYGNPEATQATWRNLWHHTGDVGYLDESGQLHFTGRKKDVIRRRGENISAFEVEEVLERHPDVIEVAVIGVPSEYTEEEVKAVIVSDPASHLAAADVLAWATGKLPPYALPRYVEFAVSLPHTETDKVQKTQLREQWRNAATFDFEADTYLSSSS